MPALQIPTLIVDAFPNPLASKTLPWDMGVARRSFVASFSIPFVLSTASYNAISAAIDAYLTTWREVYVPRGNPRSD